MPFLVPDKPFPCCLAPPFPLVAWRLIPLSPIHNPRFSPKIQENRPRGKKNRQNAWPYQKHSVSLHPLRPLYSILGEMAEWSNAPVLKTGVLQGTGGSNPSLSATNAENQQIAKQTPSFTPKNVKSGVFVLFKIIQPLHNKRVAILKESDEKRLIFIYPFTLIFQDFTSS